MLSKLRTFIGRKLIAVILTPILMGGLVAVNAFLPEGAKFTPEQMTNIVEYIIGLVAAFVITQGVADVKNGSPGNPTKEKPEATAASADMG